VKAQNINRWAGTLIAELCQVRLETGGNGKKGKASAHTAA